MSERRLVLFSGMGADAHLYDALRERIGALVVPPWLPVRTGDLASYARRYVAQGLVRADDHLGGSSFGGMLAQEVARLVPVRSLLLIGTCRSGAGVALRLRRLARLAPIFPIMRQPATLIAWPLAMEFGATRPAQRRLLEHWIRHADPTFMRWSAQAAVHWRGAGEQTSPVFQIHGGRDRVLPPAASGADTFVAGGGHLLAATHPDEVAQWLRHALTQVD